MFATLRSIGQAADAAQNPPSVKETAALVAAELRRSARRQTLVRAHLEQQQQQQQQGDAVAPPEKPQADGCTGVERDGAGADKRPLSDHAVQLPHHIASQLCAAYARPLMALQVADTASSSLLSLRRDAEAAEVAAAALSDALPSTVLLGMAAHLLRPSCPTLRRLAASTVHEEQAALTRNARQGQQQRDDPARTRCGSSAVERVLAIVRARAADSATGGNTLKRQRSPTHTGAAPPTVGSDGSTGEARAALALPPPPPLPLPLSAPLAAPPAAMAAPLLRSTAARAQAASSRSRSRSRSPPPPPSLSPPPPPPASKPAVKAEAETVSVPTVAPSSFSFGVRVAAQRDRGAESGESGVRPAPVTASEAFVPTAPAVLRQTTLAAFTTAPAAAPADAPPSATALPGSGVATNPTALKRSASSSTWYNPPPSLPSATKAPPYQYDWRGANTAPPQPPPQPASAAAAAAMVGGGQERHEDPHYATSRPGPPSNASAAGFVTASEQLVSDIRQGRTMNSAYLSKRSPALGLRRTGFQPPFRDQQPQGGGNATAGGQDTSKGPGTPLNRNDSSSSNGGGGGGGGGGRGGKPQNTPRNPAHNEGDDDEGSYPASLLLPDGSVPAILQPLDPKLVTQVAMEILDSGAGAKQVGWEDIAGLQHAKASVEEAIVWPLRRPDLFVGLRDPPRGLLLFGPPGTGKTMIARAIANRAGCTFINISSSSLMSKWMGDGEKLVRCLFAVATVRQPSVIFIDEIDSLLSMRGEGEMDSVRRVKTEFLVQLDGVATDRGDRVLLIGATNRPDELDEAARRRMEKRLYIPLPDDTARKELIQRLLRSLSPATAAGDGEEEGEASPRTGPPAATAVAHTLTDADLNSLVEHTHGYSGADLKQLCREAAMGPLREMSVRQLSEVSATDLRPIQRRDFKQALKRLKPSVGPAEVERYVEWNRLFGSFNEEDSDADDDDEDEEGEGGRRESKKDNSD